VQTNLNAPRLVLADKLTGDEMDQLWRHRQMPAAEATPPEAHTGDDIERRYRAAQAFADEPEDQSEPPTWHERLEIMVRPPAKVLACAAVIGLLWVLW
jgi:hypothetical protein